jgi:hypothetical protein
MKTKAEILAEARRHIEDVKAGNFSAPVGSVVRDVHRDADNVSIKERAYSADLVVRKARAQSRRTNRKQSEDARKSINDNVINAPRDGFDDYVAVSIERVLGLWEEMRQRHREPPRARTLDANGIDSDAWNRWGAEVCDQRIALALTLTETQRLMLHQAIGRALAHIKREERERTDAQIEKAVAELRDELSTKQRDVGRVIDLPNPLTRKTGHA